MNNENAFLKKYVKIVVVLAVVASSSSGIFGSAIAAPSLAIGFWRLTVGVPFCAIPVFLKQREQLKAVKPKELIWTFIAGAFLFGHYFTWFNAVKLTNVASAVVLAAMHPLVVLVITAFVLRRKVGIRPVMGIFLALLGCCMVAGFDYKQLSSGNFTGDMLALGAAICMGIYFAIGNEVRKTVSGSVYVFLVFASCWICFVIGIIATKTPVLGYSAHDYLLIVAMTFVCQIGAHAVFNLCFGYVDSLYVSAWESGESVFAIVLGIIFLGQIPEGWEIVGCAVVVTGLLYYNYHTGIAEKEALKNQGGRK